MIEIIALFFGVLGALAAPGIPAASPHGASSATRDTEVLLPLSLPGLENLDEKKMPLSKLVTPAEVLPGGSNLAEKSQARLRLPGTGNLAEKRIPETILRKLFEPLNDQQIQ